MRTFVQVAGTLALAAGMLSGADDQGSFDKSLSITGPVELDVKTDAGGITVSPGSPGRLEVHAILKAQHGWFSGGDVEGRIRELEQHPPVEQSGNRVKIGYVRSEALRGISMSLEIRTPVETQLRALADSGGIRVSGIRGPVDCKTDSGGVQISDVQSDVRAAADSGGIHIHNVTGAVSARVDSGGVEATEIAGSIDAETDSGSIRLSQTRPASIRAKADSGSVSVKLARDAGYNISAETDSGRISVPEMTANSGFTKHHVEGKVRSGGPLVQVRVDSGSVTIE